MKVLLSIKPEFVSKILEGSKRYEFRKGIFKNESVTSVVIYSTLPVGRVVGEFYIKRVLQDKPHSIWEKTSSHSGISKHFFDQYFQERCTAYAIEIGEVIKYDDPISLKKFSEIVGKKITAPQSYCYLPS
ncbi:TPA: ASCH domain-containing protein [Proteus mirabilis]|uniref:ASCH domain-containing protein n=1 Tax=Proteus TaxID=583 RepID=UPI0008A3F013|nr:MULTISPECIES: ASCH domain-containing protein [Proteus]EKU8115292.1 ASCH domain-containing protein [Proteus mirabilis]MBG2968151.1 ASCH domain-containing protein [Proteus mirabilis]MBG2985461.1 ASCH domain-containing protein [Proteus mirabilis]MBI6265753.1 ASCH domain-containing protein [Proteus mirabilis]MDZ7489830.1 ASCH domain-containing protein [Proteus mirabilis]